MLRPVTPVPTQPTVVTPGAASIVVSVTGNTSSVAVSG
jgi:hypothetical protein